MNLKTFSQQSRRILIRGIAQKLLYWGFDAKGNVTEEPTTLEGGYVLRGEAFNDSAIPGKWNRLRDAIQKKGIESVIEEAAYTWFNRIMAIRILSKNGYDRAQLEYEGDSKTPTLITRARRGQSEFLAAGEKKRLQVVLTDYAKEREAFAILLTGYCKHHQLLKSIFGRLDDYTELLLPDDILEESGVIHLLNTTDAISDSDYQKVELIGWLYQFYISERKDEVFASFKKNKKAEAKDIPAATQIFTPNWIVKYMVQNTVGKLWLDLNPDSELKSQMAYLINDPAQKQAPIISEAAQLKLLDPAVGSGHILVEGFDLLYAMYQEEYYTAEEAVKSILDKNLFGLDIDTRAAQLARFAVLLKAAKYYPEVLSRGWMPQIYAMPEPVFFNRQEILDFLGKDGLNYEEELTESLKLMREAQNLGSTMMIDWSKSGREYMLKRLKELQNQTFQDLTTQLLLNRITSYIQIAGILTDQYEGVAANPPYMGSGNMNASLKEYLAKSYPESKSDLFAVFMEVCNYRNVENGLTGMINQHSWMFLSSYEKLRDTTLTNFGILNMLHLGPRTFEELSGEVVQSTAFVIQNGKAIKEGNYVRLVDYKSNKQKEKQFLAGNHRFLQIPQTNFSKIPGSPVAYWVSERVGKIFTQSKRLGEIIECRKGLATSDNNRFLRLWSEVNYEKFNPSCTNREETIIETIKWYPLDKGGRMRKWYGNKEYVINWQNDGYEIRNFKDEKGKLRSRPQNLSYSFNQSLTWSKITSGLFTARVTNNSIFDDAGAIGYKKNSKDLNYFLNILSSKIGAFFLNVMNPTLNFQIGDISNIPIIYEDENEKNEAIISYVEKNISYSKSDWDSNENSWDFEKSPLLNESPNLKTAFQIREQKVTQDFFELHQNEEELNRIFIEIYGLGEELTPEVPLTEITILQDELDSKELGKREKEIREKRLVDPEQVHLPIKKEVVMKQLISYAIGLNMGRYRLDSPGLHIAHPDPSAAELAGYIYKGHSFQIDEDGIIPLMGSAASFSDDALTRVKSFLEIVWGADTLTQNLNFLQECLDDDLENYLVKKYWKDHCQTYKKKPIYWLFTSEKGAFQVLVYMHRMNAFTVEKIRSNYLMPFLKQLRSQIDRLESSGEDPRLLDRLQKNLTESEAYELLLKDSADKQITFDLDDGVTKNYELFEGVVGKVK
jgi:type II restriction/modification system DNA methylase subunit YeeA